MGDVLYRAGFGWKGKTAFALVTLVNAAALVYCAGELANVWRDGNWLMRAASVLWVFAAVAAPLEVFVRRTIFRRDTIDHRSPIGVRRVRSYSLVERVTAHEDYLAIRFAGGGKVTIWRVHSDLALVASIIRERGGGERARPNKV